MPTIRISDVMLLGVIDNYVTELTLGILLHYNRFR